jgi:transcriptional regulator with XRE-family HTH domain
MDMYMEAREIMSIREERIQRGWTQIDLSYHSRVPASEISKIECERLKPSPGQIERIARALGVPPKLISIEASEK